VEAQVRLDTRGVHDGRDRKDEQSREEALGGGGQYFGDRDSQIDKAPAHVLDLPGKSNSCDIVSATA